MEPKRITWTPEENIKLKILIERQSVITSTELKEAFPNRNPKQCREHYINCLNDNLSKEPLTKKDKFPELGLRKLDIW